MGGIGGLLGTSGGVAGTGIAAPAQAQISQPTTAAQAQEQYTGAQNALQQQQSFVNAVNAANGIGNQSSVFNQLQGVANGTGPNPAQAMLAQSTAANTANQAALMAGQRGSSSNPGLIARQAAQQGAANQQAAAGQAATMQANQSLGALNQLGGIAGTQAAQQANAVSGLNQFQQGEQGQVLNGIAAQNNAIVGNQSSINSANAGLANTQLQGQHNMIGNALGGAGSALGLAQGGMVPKKMAEGGSAYMDIPAGTDPFAGTPAAAPAPTAPMAAASTAAPASKPGPASNVGKHFFSQSNPGAPASQPLSGTAAAGNTIGQAIGKGLNSLFGSSKAPASSAGPSSSDVTAALYGAPGMTNADGTMNNDAMATLMKSDIGSATTPQIEAAQAAPMETGAPTQMPANNDSGEPMAAKGGKVPALVSPGERYLPPSEVTKVAKGKDPMKAGEKIPGKPKHPGNDYRNDTVHKTLESGGIVLPNSVMQSKHPHWAAHAFVSAIMAKNGKNMPKKAKK